MKVLKKFNKKEYPLETPKPHINLNKTAVYVRNHENSHLVMLFYPQVTITTR